MSAPDEEETGSPLRSMMDEGLQSFAGLNDARSDPDAVAIFEGDWGGQIYAVVRVSCIRCSEAQLNDLLEQLDGLGWSEPDGASVYFERHRPGQGIAGGMGGGQAPLEVWIHPQINVSEDALRAVLNGQSRSVLH